MEKTFVIAKYKRKELRIISIVTVFCRIVTDIEVHTVNHKKEAFVVYNLVQQTVFCILVTSYSIYLYLF